MAPTTGASPVALRPCYADGSDLSTIVPCTSAHRGEILATRPATPGAASPAVASSRLITCAQLASIFTGATDPTFDGALRVIVLPDPVAAVDAPFSADTGVYYTSEPGSDWLICAIESVGERTLVDSVAGTAGGPLPWK